MLAEDTLQAIDSPVTASRQRASGLRFADARVHALWHAIILFRQLADGFRSADLRHHVAALSGRDPNAISQGAMTYQLRRLRLHGLIERLPNSFRYRVTNFGFRAALFFTRLYNRLLRPGLAAALPTLRAADGPLKRAFDRIDAQINVSITQAQLAAPEFSISYISAIERGKIRPSLKALSILARRLDVPLTFLLEGSPAGL